MESLEDVCVFIHTSLTYSVTEEFCRGRLHFAHENITSVLESENLLYAVPFN